MVYKNYMYKTLQNIGGPAEDKFWLTTRVQL